MVQNLDLGQIGDCAGLHTTVDLASDSARLLELELVIVFACLEEVTRAIFAVLGFHLKHGIVLSLVVLELAQTLAEVLGKERKCECVRV